jgi:hypothetical protein
LNISQPPIDRDVDLLTSRRVDHVQDRVFSARRRKSIGDVRAVERRDVSLHDVRPASGARQDVGIDEQDFRAIDSPPHVELARLVSRRLDLQMGDRPVSCAF